MTTGPGSLCNCIDGRKRGKSCETVGSRPVVERWERGWADTEATNSQEWGVRSEEWGVRSHLRRIHYPGQAPCSCHWIPLAPSQLDRLRLTNTTVGQWTVRGCQPVIQFCIRSSVDSIDNLSLFLHWGVLRHYSIDTVPLLGARGEARPLVIHIRRW